MKFGIHSPSWLYPGNPFDGIREKALRLEELGFAWLSVMDHMMQIPVHGPPDEPFMEGWTTLSALAAVTSKIRLATLVSSTSYRNPALLAKMAATVDVISKGRLTLGIGAGWFEDEYQQYNWEFLPKPADRIHRLEDAIKLIKAMWMEERGDYRGRFYSVKEAILQPKPIQKPHPPILVGGAGEQLTLRVVARHGNACNLIGSPQEVRHKFDVLEQHCENEDRNYKDIEKTALLNVLVARDESKLSARMAQLDAGTHFRGHPLTIPQAADLFGQYQQAGVQLLIISIYRNDEDSLQAIAEMMGNFS